MALNATLTVNGKRAGKTTSFVIGYSHEMDDAGQPGKENYKHRPFVILKAVDPASPLLHQFQTEGDELDCVLTCFRVPPGGGAASERHFVVSLKEAKIVSIRTIMENNRFQANASLPVMEEVAFAYKGIIWTYQSGDGSAAHGVGPSSPAANPAPDKLDDWAKSVMVNAFKQHTDALLNELKAQTKALYQELMGEKKPPAPK